MSSFWNKRRVIYAIIILISVFIVFVIGHFRKGLDISGGTRLMYRIAYDTYEQNYSDRPQELASVKKTVEEILKKNIDGRISTLGVSDYRSYTQQLNNETQIVVEIGGITDLEQAKELIGKTVELEFKLPNNDVSEAEKSERKTLAQNLYSDLLDNSDKFEAIAGSRQSENIYYTKYDKVTLYQLPNIYRNNVGVLNETQEGKVSPLMEGLYLSDQQQDLSGNIQDININGYTFFHMISKEEGSRDEIGLSDILETAMNLGATYDEKFTLEKGETKIDSGSYTIEGTTLTYNNGEVYPNEIAYDAKIFIMFPEVSISTDGNTSESDDDFESKVNSVKESLIANNNAEISDASLFYDGAISNISLKGLIDSFDANNTDKVQVYDGDGYKYIVVLKDKKDVLDHWYNIAVVNGIDEDKFEEAVKTQTFYTMEEIFIQDELSWVNAQSSEGKILNGANFKYAAVSTSQLGQPVVLINFDDEGKSIFCDITENNIGKQMAIFIGGNLITSPVIQARICDGSAQIDGNFTPDGAKELTSQLNDGALPAPLVLMQEEKVSPTLGENAFNGALISMVIGFIVIFLYMTYLYGLKKGLISLISLSIYTVVLFAVVKTINYALSLSGIAAIILSIGMAVDANVLIFERMKEEKENKKSDNEAISIAYDRSWNAIRDGQISTGMIGLLLMLMGINMFKGFGTMLVIGVLLTLLVNAPVIKELLQIFYKKK